MIKVLVVDDSGFFRRRIGEMLNADPEIEVIGYASNGEESISMAKSLKPNVVTMDIEMPGMNGIEATKRIMQESPTPVIMFSSLTTEGAQATLDALDAGALDFLPKRFQDIAKDIDEARVLLCDRVRAVSRTRVKSSTAAKVAKKTAAKPASLRQQQDTGKEVETSQPAKVVKHDRNVRFGILAIGTSTGGPVALQTVLTEIPADFPLPILLIQHMPSTFTPTFAKRLDQVCEIAVKEAEDGDELIAGRALLAPGGKQMLVKNSNGKIFVKIEDGEASLTYKPSVDITFRSISRIYPNNTLAIVMTGMGADGREGCRELKNLGSEVWVQDEASCVVYGMPASVAEAGLADEILDLNNIAPNIVSRV